MGTERQKYLTKIESILSEQKVLRSKDQTLFSQVCQIRDGLQAALKEREHEVALKDKHI